jgi:hypothetical protein
MDYFSEEWEESGNIYTCKLPLIQKLALTSTSRNDFGFILNKNETCKDIKKKLNTNYPFVVINPIFPEELGESSVKFNEQFQSRQEINRTDSVDSVVEVNHNNQISITDKISVGFLVKNSENN